MSTAPVTPVPASSLLAKFLNYFNTVATIATATIQQEQVDIAAGNHVAAVNDAVLGAAEAFVSVVPSQNANVTLALGLFSTGEQIVTSLVSLFHHPKVAAAVATKAAAVPAKPVA